MSPKNTAAIAAAMLCILPGAALADPSRLQLILAGEAYDGPPKFEVSFDGTVLGESTVAAAIDTVATGRFAEADDKSAYVQSFEFAIPETVFKPDGEVRVRLTNEAYGGDGSNRDRNLFLATVSVNGRAVTVSGLRTATGEGFKDNSLVGEFLLLADGNEQGVSIAPDGGWPAPSAVAVADPAVKPEEPVVTEAAAQETPRAPLRVTSVTSPEAETDTEEVTTVATTDPAATASIEPEPAVNPACSLDQLYNVVGFNENSNDLTPRLMQRLDQIIADIGDNKCKVLVTGYSSTVGSHATNALFAVERAQNVLTYLKRKGLQFERVSATGGGATTQFGDVPSANRRVVITVLP